MKVLNSSNLLTLHRTYIFTRSLEKGETDIHGAVGHEVLVANIAELLGLHGLKFGTL